MSKYWSRREPLDGVVIDKTHVTCNWCHIRLEGLEHVFVRSNIPPAERMPGSSRSSSLVSQADGLIQAKRLGKLLFCSTTCSGFYRRAVEG